MEQAKRAEVIDSLVDTIMREGTITYDTVRSDDGSPQESDMMVSGTSLGIHRVSNNGSVVYMVARWSFDEGNVPSCESIFIGSDGDIGYEGGYAGCVQVKRVKSLRNTWGRVAKGGSVVRSSDELTSDDRREFDKLLESTYTALQPDAEANPPTRT